MEDQSIHALLSGRKSAPPSADARVVSAFHLCVQSVKASIPQRSETQSEGQSFKAGGPEGPEQQEEAQERQ